MRRRRQRGRSLGVLVGCVLIASIGTLPPLASAGERKPAPAPLPSTGPKLAPPAPTTAPAPIPTIEPTLQQPTGSDSGSTGSEAGATGSGSSATTIDDPAGGGTNDAVVGDGTPRSRDLFDVDDVFGVGSPWIDSLATTLEDLASAGRSITADDLPCVVGSCEIPGSALGTIIALAGILAGLFVIAATVRRSGWIVRHR